MKRIKTIFLLAIMVLVLTQPAAALANKQIFRATLRNNAGAQRGVALVGFLLDGSVEFAVRTQNLSSQVFVAHIHSALDGSILVTLCENGNPLVPACVPGSSGPNSVDVQGVITPAMMNASGGTIVNLIRNGNAYINVHTLNFPGGEVSGPLVQITP